MEKNIKKYSNGKMLKERNIGTISIGMNQKIQYIQDFNVQKYQQYLKYICCFFPREDIFVALKINLENSSSCQIIRGFSRIDIKVGLSSSKKVGFICFNEKAKINFKIYYLKNTWK